MRVLGIETTCDETGVAIVEDGYRIVANVVNSQIPLHERFGGVVPEIASRAHTETITRLVEKAIAEAGLDLFGARPPVDVVAVANRPGLIGALLVGATAAKSLALAWDVPLIGVDHVHAHIYSALLRSEAPPERPSMTDYFPAVSLVVSGGHTTLYSSRNSCHHELIGQTTDDAAGEAFDKVASLLNLGYPGGPAISKAALSGDAKAIRFPRTLLQKDSLDFSFSGIKTAVRYHTRGQDASRSAPLKAGICVPDVAASFEEAVVDVLVEKLRRALKREGATAAIVSGGVAANQRLRRRLQEFTAADDKVRLHIPELKFCTDNAAMIAALAHELWTGGARHDLDLAVSTTATPSAELLRPSPAPSSQ